MAVTNALTEQAVVRLTITGGVAKLMSAPAFDTDKRFRSDFRAERERLLALEKESKSLDESLMSSIELLRKDAARVRGAGGLMVRLTEQLMSNRNLRLQITKELRSLRRDVVDREIRLASLQQDAKTTQSVIGATAELLKLLQVQVLTPDSGAGTLTLEPGDYVEVDADEAIRLRLGAPGEEGEPELPSEVTEGDTVADPTGKLWVLGADGLEVAGGEAEEVFLDPPDGLPPYARLEGGQLVLVVQPSD